MTEKTFNKISSLTLPQRIHPGRNPVNLLNVESFSQSAHLLQHQRVNPGEKPFECAGCGKTFSQNAHFIQYQSSYWGENLPMYKQCNKAFSQWAHLDQHRRFVLERKTLNVNVEKPAGRMCVLLIISVLIWGVLSHFFLTPCHQAL